MNLYHAHLSQFTDEHKSRLKDIGFRGIARSPDVSFAAAKKDAKTEAERIAQWADGKSGMVVLNMENDWNANIEHIGGKQASQTMKVFRSFIQALKPYFRDGKDITVYAPNMGPLLGDLVFNHGPEDEQRMWAQCHILDELYGLMYGLVDQPLVLYLYPREPKQWPSAAVAQRVVFNAIRLSRIVADRYSRGNVHPSPYAWVSHYENGREDYPAVSQDILRTVYQTLIDGGIENIVHFGKPSDKPEDDEWWIALLEKMLAGGG